MEKTNTLKFELFDPVEAGETWAITWGFDYKVVEIYVDGEKLLDIIREIEAPYANEEGYPELAGAYGHISQRTCILVWAQRLLKTVMHVTTKCTFSAVKIVVIFFAGLYLLW